MHINEFTFMRRIFLPQQESQSFNLDLKSENTCIIFLSCGSHLENKTTRKIHFKNATQQMLHSHNK